jgi:dolichol-phosphate mannosyltransferase
MANEEKISLLMATYNEEKHIAESVSTLYNYAKGILPNFELIVVDDGSLDKTYEELAKLQKKFPIKIDKNPVNLGQGGAFRRGLTLATGEVIITFDSDLSYPIADIPRLLEKINEGNDVVTTSPFTGSGNTQGVPLLRLFLSNTATFLYSTVLGVNLTSVTGVFRAYRADLLKGIGYKSNRFEAQVEILWLCKKKGAKIAEIPSVLKFKYRKTSSFKLFRDIKTHLVLITKLFFDRIFWTIGKLFGKKG